MAEGRSVTALLVSHFRLSSNQCPNSQEENDEMSRVPYASAVGSLMYAMICTCLTTYAVSILSRFISKCRQATLKSSEVGATILRRTARLGFAFQSLKMGKPKIL